MEKVEYVRELKIGEGWWLLKFKGYQDRPCRKSDI